MKRIVTMFVLSLVFCLGMNEVKGEDAIMVIQKGKKVAFDYTLTVEGEVADTSEGKAPLTYTHGEGQIIPGLAKEMEGLKVGDDKIVTVTAKDAYGELNPKAFKEIPNASLPPELKPEVGMFLEMQNSDGQSMPVQISEVKEDSIMIDFNHPLAGKELTFKVKVVSIN